MLQSWNSCSLKFIETLYPGYCERTPQQIVTKAKCFEKWNQCLKQVLVNHALIVLGNEMKDIHDNNFDSKYVFSTIVMIVISYPEHQEFKTTWCLNNDNKFNQADKLFSYLINATFIVLFLPSCLIFASTFFSSIISWTCSSLCRVSRWFCLLSITTWWLSCSIITTWCRQTTATCANSFLNHGFPWTNWYTCKGHCQVFMIWVDTVFFWDCHTDLKTE